MKIKTKAIIIGIIIAVIIGGILLYNTIQKAKANILIDAIEGLTELTLDVIGALISPMLKDSNGFPVDIQTAIGTILAYGQQLSFIVPWKTLFGAFAIVFGWDMAFVLFRFIKWGIGIIRGGS